MALKVLVGMDGSDPSFRALDFAINFCERFGASLDILHVAPNRAPPAILRDFARSEHLAEQGAAIYQLIGEGILETALHTAHQAGLAQARQALTYGEAAKGILDYAQKHGIGVIVVGSRGLSEFRGLLLGSVSLKVSTHAHCTCIVVR
jgi:nucleotide-binding universal stress UspA family protein